MRFNSFSISLASLPVLTLPHAPCATAQFTFPSPLKGNLSDYTSGAVRPTLNFSAGDSMYDGWNTPGDLLSFLVYRCTGSTASNATIKRLESESTFNSSMGRTYPDKTWAYMPMYTNARDMHGNGYLAGKDPSWFHEEFLANNERTGDLCWFELYPGRYVIEPSQEANGGSVRVTYISGEGKTWSDNGECRRWDDRGNCDTWADNGEWYLASAPFKVDPPRPSNMTVTWKEGVPSMDIKNQTKEEKEEFYSQFPSLKPSAIGSSGTSGAHSVALQALRVVGMSCAVSGLEPVSHTMEWKPSAY